MVNPEVGKRLGDLRGALLWSYLRVSVSTAPQVMDVLHKPFFGEVYSEDYDAHRMF
jgi:hypothetical protein